MTSRSEVTVGIIGALSAVAATIAPRVWDKATGGKRDAQDGAAVLAGGASDVTAAALAVLEQMRADRDECRRELADQDQRCRAEIAELRAEVEANRRRLEELHPR